MIIAPSILSADFSRLADEVQAVEAAGVDWIHVDVMDGRFVPNITMGPVVVESIRKVTKLPIDVHLMIEEPERYVKDFRQAGADIISIHVEATRHLQRTLSLIKESGAKPSVALNPATPLFTLDHVWNDIEMVLIMSVNPGFSGQKFIPEITNKIRALKKKSERLAPNIRIEVDGGVTVENIRELNDAGASAFVSGSTIFSSGNYKETVSALRRTVTS